MIKINFHWTKCSIFKYPKPFASPSFGFVGIHLQDLWNIWNLQILKALDWSTTTRGPPSSELKSFELASFSCTLQNSDRLRACNCTIFMQFSGLKNILKVLVSKCGCHNFSFQPLRSGKYIAQLLSWGRHSVCLCEFEWARKFARILLLFVHSCCFSQIF